MTRRVADKAQVMPLADDIVALRAKFAEARASRAAEQKAAQEHALAEADANEDAAVFNGMLTRALVKRNAPQGYALDLHGDGHLKPPRECAPAPPPTPPKE